MDKYIDPKLDIIAFEVEDVIATSVIIPEIPGDIVTPEVPVTTEGSGVFS